MENATPMLRQYLEIKKAYPGTILFFRLGDFYEMFNEDAVLGSRELGITLTARQKDSNNPIPMCGVPHHAAGGYISKLVGKGFRVAICEQAEDAGKGAKLVRREVVRVVTPGTAIDSQTLEGSESVYLGSVFASGDSVGVAFLELSTGEFLASAPSGSDAWAKAKSLIESTAPKEILFPENLRALVTEALAMDGLSESPQSAGFALTGLDAEFFDPIRGRQALLERLGTKELTAFGLGDEVEAISAAAAALRYAQETQRASATHVSEIRFLQEADHLVLDRTTLKNLEVVEAQGDSRKRTLLGVIDSTLTGMGARLLRSWVMRPSLKRGEIEARLDAVSELGDSMVRDGIRLRLKEVYDLERLVGRVNLGTATARDLLALGKSLSPVPAIDSCLSGASCFMLRMLREGIHSLPEIRELIATALSDDPPLNLSDGGTIREGFNEELDEIRALSSGAKTVIARYEDEERHRTGIGSLKVRFNNVFGYYIEISKANLPRVPADYERRQTLANAERFTTPYLKDWERKVLSAEERIIALESEIFADVRGRIRAETQRLMSTARGLSTLDALAALAETAALRRYARPEIHDGDEIDIREGRHPVVEAFLGQDFVPNDTFLNNSTDRLLLVTGPNMGGKSTILRQVALIQILAQIGSFVPAAEARLPVVDRIWTRVGASDDVASGRSTFMVEMTETATILNNATPRGLILLDEIGRGTSTFDGLAVAWAVAEHVHNSPLHSAKTIFATHYHELTELAESLPGAKNYRVLATEKDGSIVFLHKLAAGKATESYGIAVAKLAGVPPEVIARARDVLARLEMYELAILGGDSPPSNGTQGSRKAGVARLAAQVSLFDSHNEALIGELKALDIETLDEPALREALASIKKRLL